MPIRLPQTLVPLAGIEPALLAELDFESSASTSSATGARRGLTAKAAVAKPAEYSGRACRVNPRVSDGLEAPLRAGRGAFAAVARQLPGCDRQRMLIRRHRLVV
jgi:hypothetical protein